MERSHSLAFLVFATSLCLSAYSKTGSISPAPTAKPASVDSSIALASAGGDILSGSSAVEIQHVVAALNASRHDAIGLAGWEHASFTRFKVAEANCYNFLSREEIGTGTFSVEIFLTADPDPDGNATSVNS